MNIVNLIIQAISGIVGGNIVGAAWKEKTLGAVGNSIAGLIGGVAGGYILQAVGILHTMGMDTITLGSIVGDIGGGAVGGAVLTGIVGYIKSLISKKPKG